MVVKDAQTGWYLIFTKPRQEDTAKINLERQGFITYFPLLQLHKRVRNLYQVVTEPLFPRYIFIHLNSEIGDWSKIRSTRGCISLVRFGMLPACVPDALIEQLRGDESKRLIQQEESTPDFKTGDRIQVLDGILGGYEGIVQMKNSQQRVTLLLALAEGHTRSVTLPVHQVKLVG